MSNSIAVHDGASPSAPIGDGEDDFFYTDAHWSALDLSLEALSSGQGAIALLGPVGSGRSTIAKKIARELPPTMRGVFASAGVCSADDIWAELADAVGAQAAAKDASTIEDALRARLAQLATADLRIALFIDDADGLDDAALTALDALTTLGVLEDGRSFGAQIVLVGATALRQRLLEHGAAELQTAGRTASRLRALTADETENMLRSRLERGEENGRGPRDIGQDAVEQIIQRTGGSPGDVDRLARHLAVRLERRPGASPVTRADIDEAADAIGFVADAGDRIDEVDDMLEVEVEVEVPTDEAPETAEADLEIDERPEPPLSAPGGVASDGRSSGGDASSGGRGATATEPPLPAGGKRSKPAPLRQRRRGPRLVDPGRQAKVRRNLARAIAAFVLVAGGVATFLVVDNVTAQGQRSTLAAGSSDESGVVGVASDKLAAIEQDIRERAAQTYEQNRGVVLNALDGAMEIAEATARKAASSDSAIGGIAADIASDLAAERKVLATARAVEMFGEMPPEEAGEALQRHLDGLFQAVETRIQAERYTRPLGESAYDALLEAYSLSPADPRALTTFTRLADFYDLRARLALSDSQFEEYHRLNELAERIRARRPI